MNNGISNAAIQHTCMVPERGSNSLCIFDHTIDSRIKRKMINALSKQKHLTEFSPVPFLKRNSAALSQTILWLSLMLLRALH